MFQDEDLKKHLESASVVKTKTAVIAEWNLNSPTNIFKIGNYRYRPTQNDSLYKIIPSTFDPLENKDTLIPFYFNATDSDVVIDGGFDDDGLPVTLKQNKEKLKMLYSLEDCFKMFRPRSGINKARYLPGNYLHHPNINMANRPRYYMPDKKDYFKYWTSFRTEEGIEYGISIPKNGENAIEDTAPFIVYNEEVAANRIIVKMQTHVGNKDLGTFSSASQSISDPFYGDSKKATPVRWKIQALKNNSWSDIVSFTQSSTRSDGTPIIGPDGYVEISYGLKVPKQYRDIFIFAEQYASDTLLPEKALNGYSYLITENENDIGTFYIWLDEINDYRTFTPDYGWYLEEAEVDRLTNFVKDMTNPAKFTGINNSYKYREFEKIKGIRLVVDTMNKPNCTFDLIEISPRLCADISDKVRDFSLKKNASDLGVSGMPVGQLLASTGSLTIFDYDDAFNNNNENSIIKNLIDKHIQFKFYDIIFNVDGWDYYVPLKTLYSDSFPDINNTEQTVALELRDMFFYFENITAPQTLMTSVSLSSAVSMLLDSIGFSNYVFKRVEGETELIIPFFHVEPDTSVAEVLQDLAISSQTAMFFDEYNNFVMMSKDYMMPTEDQRATDLVISGNEKESESDVMPNIIEISSQENKVYNDGKINYSEKYIQRSVGTIKQASLIDMDRSWIYKPVLLWEVTGTENTKSINGETSTQSSYTLSAIPLNSDLTATLPEVVNREVINNVIDFGEGIYWIARYNGYFYSNGEIIKYDAVQFNVSGVGNVWISSNQEYQYYFSSLPFNGKIYPTGLVRIYSEPNYEEVNGFLKLKNGPVAVHGRAQFGTSIALHSAGLSEYWVDNNNMRGCMMQSKYLFENNQEAPSTVVGLAGSNNELAKKTTRTGVIRNFMSSTYNAESDVNNFKQTKPGTIQSSALVMQGPSFSATDKPRDFVSYLYKSLDNRYKHFGTRMRIIGRIENGFSRGQTANGSTNYFVVPGLTPDKDITISGGGGGLAVMINPETNNGYYLELSTLGSANITMLEKQNVHNVMFYKIKKDSASSDAIPVKIWEGLGNIIVDDGKFTGQYRMVAEQNPTVYDIGIEYEDIGSARRFHLYMNGALLTTVVDQDPLPAYNNMALFVRGSSRVMFENIYALANNYSQNTQFALNTPVNSIFDDEIDATESFRKYAMSGVVQGTYLSGISSSEPPKYNIYFEEFGTIMREAATFNIKYDKAYPALYAKLSPTFNRIKGYTVSGFRAGSYGAEFLIFNATDTALSLDETTGNYLRIQGVTFTQQSTNELTVDDYFIKNSSLSDPVIEGSNVIVSPFKIKKDYEDIKLSRMTYGRKDFSINTTYVQTQDDANSLMKWLIGKISKPRKAVGVKIFNNPTIQLGDLVSIKYVKDDIEKVENTRYVVYYIDYSKDISGPSMTLYLSEVL
jgi:hypothetical protein